MLFCQVLAWSQLHTQKDCKSDLAVCSMGAPHGTVLVPVLSNPRSFTEHGSLVCIVRIWVQTQLKDLSVSVLFQSDLKPLPPSARLTKLLSRPRKVQTGCNTTLSRLFQCAAQRLHISFCGLQRGQLTSIMFSCFALGMLLENILKNTLCGLFSHWQECVCAWMCVFTPQTKLIVMNC